MNDHATLIDTRVQSLVERLEETGRTPTEYAEANELELVFDDAGHPISTADRARAHREILTEQLAPIEDAFDDYDVPFVVIKDPYLPKPISDIDVLIDDPDGAHAALSGVGFELEDDTEPHRETYVKTVDGARVAIDLHLALSWRRVPYLSTREILDDRHRRSIAGQSVPCPSLEHHLAITAAHSVFKHNALSMFEVLETTYLLEEFDPDEEQLHAIARKYNWQPQLAYFLGRVAKTDALIQHGWHGTDLTIETFPEYYPLSRVGWVRGRKVAADLASGEFRRGGVSAIAYTIDVTQHVVEQRAGVSMKPVFDAISWGKRRIDD